MSEFAQTYEGLLHSIRHQAATRPVTLVGVTKTVPVPVLETALAAGLRCFAENYVQEATAKWPALRARYPDLSLRLIGPLQRNKAAAAVALFDRIDTLDRPSLVPALARAMEKAGRCVPLLIEVNSGGEPQKPGCLPQAVPELLALAATHGLKVQGFMCVPPFHQDPTPYFEQCAALAAQHHRPVLSMGMSADYLLAIKTGATEVRIGTALFGARLSQAAFGIRQ